MIIKVAMAAVLAATSVFPSSYQDGTLPPPPQPFCRATVVSPTMFTYSCNYPRKVYVYRKFDGVWRLIGTM